MQQQQLPSLLYKYFTQTGSVNIPSIGNLVSSKTDAVNDFVVKELRPGSISIDFSAGDQQMDIRQFEYLVNRSGDQAADVKHALVVLGEELHHRLHLEKKLEWMDVGSFFVDENGRIQFQPKVNHVELHKPVHYQHVIRKDAVYEMRVGEEQKSTVEMENYFEEQRSSAGKNKWKTGAFVLVGLIVVALLVRYSKGSFKVLDGRYQKINFTGIQSTYKVL